MPDEEDSGPELSDYLAVIRRRKWTIALVLIVVVSISLTRSFLTTPVYRATATVLLQPRSTDSLFNPSTGARNDPERAVQMATWGIDGICTDVPDVILAAL